MAKASNSLMQLDLKNLQAEAQRSAQRALQAGVGVTDLAVGVVRDYVAGTQQRVAEMRRNVSDFEPRAFGIQAVKTVNGQVLAVPARFEQVVAVNMKTATETYADLVTRGRTLAARIRRQQSTLEATTAAETTVTKAKTARTQATGATQATARAAKKAAPASKKRAAARSSAKATGTAAKKTASSASRALTDAARKVGD
jgi:hypothetical protein